MEKLVLKHGDYIKVKHEAHLRYIFSAVEVGGLNFYQGCIYPLYLSRLGVSVFYSHFFPGYCTNEIFVDPPLTIENETPLAGTKHDSEKTEPNYSHYFKDVSSLGVIDVYRVCDLFGIDDPSGAIHHAIKKLLCSGKRGAKNAEKDLIEARDTINRKLQMIAEDAK